MKSFISVLLLSTLFSCSHINEEKEYSGIYTFGSEISSFIPCNENKEYWLNGNKTDMKLIQSEVIKLSTQRNAPYQNVYIEFTGKVENRDPVGFEEDFDGLLYLNKLDIYSEVIPEYCENLTPHAENE